MPAKIKKYLLPIAIITILILLAKIIANNPPQSKRGRPASKPQLNIDVVTIKNQDLPIIINSYGTVKPRTQSMLLPQVSGQITWISDNFRDGGFFEEGEVLVKLDDRDYQAEVKIAQASLYSAKQVFIEEQARVEQAKQDWQRLGNEGQPSDLVLRKPQLLSAESKVFSAEASLAKAKLKLERTRIKAPYTGRILKKEVDLGQVISQSTRLAEIYAVDYVEIRLPIKNKDLPYIQLPESNRLNPNQVSYQPNVTIYSDLNARQSWQGKIVRTEGAFDSSSQQLFVVAQIDDPYGKNQSQGLPIKIGQYVSAEIEGIIVPQALTIPNRAIYQGSYIYLVENGMLKRQNVELSWQNEDIAIVSSGATQGQLLAITPLGQVNSGTKVTINKQDGKQIVAQKKGSKGNADGNKSSLKDKQSFANSKKLAKEGA